MAKTPSVGPCHDCPQLAGCLCGGCDGDLQPLGEVGGDPCGVCQGGTTPKRGRAVFWRSLRVSPGVAAAACSGPGDSWRGWGHQPGHRSRQRTNPPREQRRDPAATGVTSARTLRPPQVGKLRHGASPRTPRGQSPAPPRAVPFGVTPAVRSDQGSVVSPRKGHPAQPPPLPAVPGAGTRWQPRCQRTPSDTSGCHQLSFGDIHGSISGELPFPRELPGGVGGAIPRARVALGTIRAGRGGDTF